MCRTLSLKVLMAFLFTAINTMTFANKKLSSDYIQTYKHIAIAEMKRTGIPASIKLAQGLLESDLGRSPLAMSANNHFGIKCGSDWPGDQYFLVDDDKDNDGNVIESCFRSFVSADESYIAHSEFLTNPKKQSRYGFLFGLASTDYEGWANGLKYAGYATDPNYASKLIKIIESNRLDQYDEPIFIPKQRTEEVVDATTTTISKQEKVNTSKSTKRTTSKKTTSVRATFKTINDIKMVYAEDGESILDVANRTGKDVFELLEFNEGVSSQDEILSDGDIIFLSKKKKFFHDQSIAYHTVAKGEDMYTISQKYGLRLENLLAKNNLSQEALPLEGQQISLIKNVAKKDTPRHRFVEKFDSYVDLGGLK